MSNINAKVYQETPDKLTIASGGLINVETGGKMTANGVQAVTIATQTGAAGATPTQAEYAVLVAAFNALVTACKNVGIIA